MLRNKDAAACKSAMVVRSLGLAKSLLIVALCSAETWAQCLDARPPQKQRVHQQVRSREGNLLAVIGGHALGVRDGLAAQQNPAGERERSRCVADSGELHGPGRDERLGNLPGRFR